jgi:PAS domain S-box-containing protein
VAKKAVKTPTAKAARNGASARGDSAPAGEVLVADIIIKNAPDPVFVSDLQGKILHANDAVSQLLGIRQDEVVEHSLSRFISEEETREFTAALREVVERGVTRSARLNPRVATGEVIATSLNASALRDGDGNVVGAIGVLRDMRPYEEVVRDLEQSKAELQKQILAMEEFEELVVRRERKAIALQRELVATVSHEVRTPLAAIYGSAQTLLRRDIELDPASKERLLAVIVSESERLTRIASDILLANNIDSGRLRLDRHPLDVGGLASEVVGQMRDAFSAREDVVIELEPCDEPAFVAGEEDKLRQVLINLVDNAVKYSPDGGHVKVRIEPNEHRLRLLVLDEGLGIAHGEQRRIFGKFYRVDPQQTGGVGGTGLGLYISRELVRLMGGQLSVTSKEQEGSTFVVELPREPAPKSTATQEPAAAGAA